MVTFLKPTVILDRDIIDPITNSHIQMLLPIELPPTAEHYLIPLPSPPMVICGMQYVGETEDRVPTQSSALTTCLIPCSHSLEIEGVSSREKNFSEELYTYSCWPVTITSQQCTC